MIQIMKKLIYVAIAAIFCFSCEKVHEGEDNFYTKTAMIVHGTSSYLIADYISVAHYSSLMSQYIYAENEFIRDSLKRRVFNRYNIKEESENIWLLYDENIVWKFYTSGAAITDKDVVWSVSCSYAGHPSASRVVIGEGKFLIKCGDKGKWLLNIDKVKSNYVSKHGSIVGSAKLEVTLDDLFPKTDIYIYTVKGSGDYQVLSDTNNGRIGASYRIILPSKMNYSGYNFYSGAYFVDGKFDYHIFIDKGIKKSSIDLTDYRENDRVVHVEYDGRKETLTNFLNYMTYKAYFERDNH